MTLQQKNKIINMRLDGCSYTAISCALGIPVPTLKAFCQRHRETIQKRRCKNCGRPLTQPKGKRKNLHTMSGEGELMLTILASYAQEESHSASENQKWRIQKNFQEGMPWKGAMLGYRYDKGKYRIIPEEAEIVRTIFQMYLSGLGIPAIIRRLKESGVTTELGNQWSRTGISKLLRNYSYTGNLLLQKVYRENHLTKRTLVNQGELPQYHATDTHPAIIDMDTFLAVQKEIQSRADKYNRHSSNAIYPFTGKLVCVNCGKHYRRKVRKNGAIWICTTYNALGKAHCPSKQIPENTLYNIAAEALELDEFDVDIFLNEITDITAENGNLLTFRFRDGTETVKQWSDRSRAASWTPEMRTAVGQKTRERLEQKKEVS